MIRTCVCVGASDAIMGIGRVTCVEECLRRSFQAHLYASLRIVTKH